MHCRFADTELQKIPCSATASGGDIDVECATNSSGKLIVTENSWTGWQANRDGIPIALDANRWLSVEAPAGSHHYEFRYRPWDVWVGLLLTLIGIVLCVRWWFRSPGTKSTIKAEVPQTESPSPEPPALQP